jgi:hypothetical protein
VTIDFGANYDHEVTVDIDTVDLVDLTPSPLDVLIAAEELRPRRRISAPKPERVRVPKETKPRVRNARIASTSEELGWEMEVEAIRSHTRTAKGGACVLCGSKRHVQRHHERYDRPQETIDLCGHHHRKRHWRLKKQGRDPVVVYMAQRRAGMSAPLEAKRLTTPSWFSVIREEAS